MIELLLWGGIFVFTLTTLIIAADFFIKSSEKIGIGLGIPPFIIGLTLIAVGTSLPELVTSIIAILDHSPGSSKIVLGNVIGSNITNLCLILGIIGVIGKKIQLQFNLLKVDLPMLIGATLLLYLSIADKHFSIFEAIIFLSALILYLVYVMNMGNEEFLEGNHADEKDNPQVELHYKSFVILVISGVSIYFSADWNVYSIVKLSALLNTETELIAQTAVALGTSLPELVVSIVAIKTGNTDMAVGNILGSNVFNIFAVVAIPSFFGVLIVPESLFQFSIPLMVGCTLLVFFILQDKILTKWEGWLLILFYGLFLGNIMLA